jgi:hypothetical protein
MKRHKMSDITLDFMSPDWDYFIATSCYRDEIQFLTHILDQGDYLVRLETLNRAQTNIAARRGKINGETQTEFARGLIIVESLEPDIIMPTVRSALAQGFFLSQKSLTQLPLGVHGPQQYDYDRHIYYSTPISNLADSYLAIYGRDKPPTILEIVECDEYRGLTLNRTLVTVETSNGLHYSVTLVSPQAVSDYFDLLSERSNGGGAKLLAIPGLVIVDEIERANVADVTRSCQKTLFLTLEPS